MIKNIKIGVSKNEFAFQYADIVKTTFMGLGYDSQIVGTDLSTKTLVEGILSGDIELAIYPYSEKTIIEQKNIVQCAILQRHGFIAESHNIISGLPRPTQGIMGVAALVNHADALEVGGFLNDEDTEKCAFVESEFHKAIGGSSKALIGAQAQVIKGWLKGDKMSFKGVLLSSDGTEKLDVELDMKLGEHETIAKKAVKILMDKGGDRILKTFAHEVKSGPDRVQLTPLDMALHSNEPRSHSGKITVISTQTLPAEHAALVHKDINLVGLEFIATEFRDILPENIRTDSMIISSPMVVRSLLNSFPMLNWRFKNIYCIGGKTKSLVEERLGRVAYTAFNAPELAKYLLENMSGRAITYFCGNKYNEDIPKLLGNQNIKVTKVVTYDTDYLAPEINHDFLGVMFYSSQAVRSFGQANSTTDKTAFCVSENTAHEARTYFKNVQTAKLPTINALIELVNGYYGKV